MTKKIIAILVAVCLAVVGLAPLSASAAAPKLSTTSKTLYVADSYTLKVSGSGIKSKKFTSSNKKYVTVTSKGVVKAVKKGSATVTVTVKYKSGKKTVTKKLKCKFTVKAFVTPKLTPTSKTVKVGETFTVTRSGSNITSVTFVSSNKSVATVTSKGVVKGVSIGTATVTATITYKQAGKTKTKTATCKVTVTDEEGFGNEIIKP